MQDMAGTQIRSQPLGTKAHPACSIATKERKSDIKPSGEERMDDSTDFTIFSQL
jgi:hypothetical protein